MRKVLGYFPAKSSEKPREVYEEFYKDTGLMHDIDGAAREALAYITDGTFGPTTRVKIYKVELEQTSSKSLIEFKEVKK